MKHSVVVLLLLFSVKAWSCSCFGIAPIEETIVKHPILVEAQVVSLEEVESPEQGLQVHSATLRVTKTLKGSLSSNAIVVEHSMCYSSLYPQLMKIGHTYILPLQQAPNDRHRLAGCAHSGMELLDGKLYTYEQTTGAQRRLQLHAEYSEFQHNLK